MGHWPNFFNPLWYNPQVKSVRKSRVVLYGGVIKKRNVRVNPPVQKKATAAELNTIGHLTRCTLLV
jgi:hypothetical protein